MPLSRRGSSAPGRAGARPGFSIRFPMGEATSSQVVIPGPWGVSVFAHLHLAGRLIWAGDADYSAPPEITDQPRSASAADISVATWWTEPLAAGAPRNQ